MARFSDIRRGGELKTGLDNYVKYLTDMTTNQTKKQKGGTYKASTTNRIDVAVIPFGVNLPSTSPRYVVSASDKALKAGSPTAALFSDRVHIGDAITAAERVSVDSDTFKPAKASVFLGSGAGSYVQSKITKLYYIKYVGESYNAVFGAASETEEFSIALGLIRGKVAKLANDIKRVSFKPEYIHG